MKDKKNIIIAVEVVIIIVLIIITFEFKKEEKGIDVITSDVIAKEEISTNIFYVDIKGEVKKPGVYLVDDTLVVNDVIKLAGGLTSKANTKNINLSQEVKKEMVIYVFSKNELKKTTTPVLNDVVCTTNVIEVIENTDVLPTTTVTAGSTSDNQTKLVNINTASKEELMSLPSIGEAKADSIIIYRQSNKFTKIEDIKNVSGIGESYFAKIKDLITV